MIEGFSDEKRRDLSFHVLSMIREAMNIAKKTPSQPVTYEQAFDTLHDLNEELYNDVVKELPQQNVNETAKLFLAKANLSNEENAQKAALEEIQKEIDLNETLIANGSGDEQSKRHLRNRQHILISAKNSLYPRRIREHRILQRDFSKIDRTDFGAQFNDEDDYKVDYTLGKDSYLRLRLLHPENMEAVTGADLVYEQHDLEKRKIRVMFLQYKIWDENGVMYFSKGSLEAQLRKMKIIICERGFCQPPSSLIGEFEYRFPYCSCFLRPTDAVQETNTKLISSGIHIPVCSALKLRDEGALSLAKSELRAQTLTHTIFEPLFNKSFVGSRWLTEEELRNFYIETGILDPNESLMVYAREIVEDQTEIPF